MKRIILNLLLITIFFISCDSTEKEQFITASINEDHSSIVDPRERWEAYHLSNYFIEQSWACECLPPSGCSTFIVNGIVTEIKYELDANGYYGRTKEEIYAQTKTTAMTVDDAFDLIDIYKENSDLMIIEYDQRFGFPTRIFFDIDSLMADEEINRRFSGLQRIVNH